MSGSKRIELAVAIAVVIERKRPDVPRFVVVPAARLAAWQLTKTAGVDCMLNGVAIGRRTLKRWDAQRWFVELPERTCQRAGVDVGDRVTLSIRLAPTDMPQELSDLVRRDPKARLAWSALSESRRRMLQEEVRAAVRVETRVRRARCGLGLPAS